MSAVQAQGRGLFDRLAFGRIAGWAELEAEAWDSGGYQLAASALGGRAAKAIGTIAASAMAAPQWNAA